LNAGLRDSAHHNGPEYSRKQVDEYIPTYIPVVLYLYMMHRHVFIYVGETIQSIEICNTWTYSITEKNTKLRKRILISGKEHLFQAKNTYFRERTLISGKLQYYN